MNPCAKFSVFSQPTPMLGKLDCMLYKSYVHPFLWIGVTFTDFFEIGLIIIFRDIFSKNIFEMALLASLELGK